MFILNDYGISYVNSYYLGMFYNDRRFEVLFILLVNIGKRKC